MSDIRQPKKIRTKLPDGKNDSCHRPRNIPGLRIEQHHDKLLSVFDSGADKITITDWWYDYTESERDETFQCVGYSKSDEALATEMYFIGADLIHDGKCMIIDRKTGQQLIKKFKIPRKGTLRHKIRGV